MRQLWRTWRDALRTLHDRGVLRSTGGPVGDYGEWLVAQALGLERASYPNPAFDAVDRAGARYSIKTRRWGRAKPPTRIAIADLTPGLFEYLVFLLVDDEMRVLRCVQLPFEAVREIALASRGAPFTTRNRVLKHPAGVDLTARLQAAEPD